MRIFAIIFFPGEIKENQSFALAALDGKTIFESRYFVQEEHNAIIKVKFQWYYNDSNDLIIDLIATLKLENYLVENSFFRPSDKAFFDLGKNFRVYYF